MAYKGPQYYDPSAPNYANPSGLRDTAYIAGRDGPEREIPVDLAKLYEALRNGNQGGYPSQPPMQRPTPGNVPQGQMNDMMYRDPSVWGQQPMQRPTPGTLPPFGPDHVPYIDVGDYPGGIHQWMADQGMTQQRYTGRSPQQIARDNAAKSRSSEISGNRAEIDKLRGMMGSEENTGNVDRQRKRAMFLQRQNKSLRKQGNKVQG